ncbi:putative N6-adenine-specific DNA methylase [Lishizhenia tianjinensis]|uniref:Putative N6-adenine-specific DNA methylase n=1 Tax=Lishizhenia tianjinensis TaxID=477690 RepID=A0A1I6YS20_9FLAO|nr:THUMP domain-containing protein [Lishizhenia tianjinensis]SFT53257.1 putative N6-adenine-specific DNA methylase [Lishizhenia tianjinensis]
MKNLTITVKTLFGLEQVLKQEIEELGYKNVKELNRAVQLEGDWKTVYDLNLNLRCAISVLVELDSFRITEEKDIYKRAKRIDWTSLFTMDNTFAVKGAVNSTLFNHSQFPFLLVKDAIADVFREKEGERPDVDLRDPDVMIDLYVREKQVTLSLNTSGVPLFQRGYRTGTGEAPLNEVVAAGLLKLSGWDRKSTLIDPFCGSGTLVIEAALMAANIPANIKREYYAFQGLKTFDEKAWKEIYAKANKNAVDLGFTIYGSDLDGEVIVKARRNAGVLPIVANVDFSVANFKDVKRPTPKGMLITNPPYGERMGENIDRMYEELGDWFKQELKGYECWVISSSEDGFKNLGLRPDRRLKLYNGSLPCSFRKYSIYDGSKRAKFNNEEYKPKPRKGKPAPAPKKRKEETDNKEQVVTNNLMDKIRKIRGEGASKYGKREDD